MASTGTVHLARAAVRRVPALRPAVAWLLAHSPALRRSVHRRLAARADAEYRAWAAAHDTPAEADRAAIAARVALLPPLRISVVMPVFNPRAEHFRAAIASVRAQLWPHWELCIADDASTAPHVAQILAEIAGDPRISIVRREQNGHISAASNSALSVASGEFVALMDHDDLLPPHALYCIAEEVAKHPDAALIYSDEDQLDARGRRCEPAFKPDFDLDLLLARNLVSHLGVFRTALLRELGGLREGFEGSQDHDLALRVAAIVPPESIRHVPRVLYHWRQAGAASFSERELARCADASRRAVGDFLAATNTPGEAAVHPLVPAAVRVLRPLPAPPLASIIVPTRDRADLLARCAQGVLHGTDFPGVELLIVDNGSTEAATTTLLAQLAEDSRVRVLRNEQEFNFAGLCNQAAEAARGEVFVLLNNDIEIVEKSWLRTMAAHAVRPDIGAVGAKLLYPDGRVQHAGIVLGAGPHGVAAHLGVGAQGDAPGPSGLLRLERQVGAVTAACLVLRRDAWRAVGGMDEKNLPVAYNDVDLCLRLRAAGLKILWTPFAELIHHESATRGPDDSGRLHRAAAFMRARWGEALARDPFYSPNFSLAEPWRLRPPAVPAAPAAAPAPAAPP
jgi:glycosyltransferase involved in cell wall biosynthesis